MGIATREIEAMRLVQEEFMPDTCTVQRPLMTINEAGSSTVTWTDVYTDLACEVTPKVLRQIIEHVGGGQVQSAVRWNVTMPYGTIIQLDDRITVHSDIGNDGVYEVNGTQSVESYETATVAQCLKVE
jgi:hypothetical protein